MRWGAALSIVCALVLAAGVGAQPNVSKLLLGIHGDPGRFQSQTGQKSAIQHIFLGWQQGMTWGRRIDVYLPQLAPIPMLHLGIGGPGAVRVARITMQQIATGQGDAYLVHLNKAINGFGGLVYVRAMAEMNADKALYNSANGPGFSPQWYRLAFARIYLILHGGPRMKIDVALKRLGLPYLTVHEDLPPNPKGKLRVIWNPVAGHGGWLRSIRKKVGRPSRQRHVQHRGGTPGARTKKLDAFAPRRQEVLFVPRVGQCGTTRPASSVTSAASSSRGRRRVAAYFDSKAGASGTLPKPTPGRRTLLPDAARVDAQR